jgi:hypothetical protein
MRHTTAAIALSTLSDVHVFVVTGNNPASVSFLAHTKPWFGVKPSFIKASENTENTR